MNKGSSDVLSGLSGLSGSHAAGGSDPSTVGSRSSGFLGGNLSGSAGSSVYAPLEMNDSQICATLDALMSGADYNNNNNNNNWSGGPTVASFGSPSLAMHPVHPGNPVVQPTGRGDATMSNPSNTHHLTSSALASVLSFNQFGGGAMSTASSSCGVSDMTQNTQVTFAPIQSASSEVASDQKKKKATTKKRRRGSISSAAVSEDEGDRGRRRQDRNQREQQRSQQISQQIDYLRDLLSTSNVQFKPDKYSTLVTVADFIRDLQEKVKILDAEHKGLLDTIVQTTSIVNAQHTTPVAAADMKVTDVFDDGNISPLGDEDGPMFVSGLDYKAVFEACPIANAITSIDGRFLDCNQDFEDVSGYSKSELVVKANSNTFNFEADDGKKPARSLSLFNVVKREHMETIFQAMSEMLKLPFPESSFNVDYQELDQWSGVVSLLRRDGAKIKLCVCLIRGSQGRPKYFICTLLPVGEETTVTANPITSAAIG